MIGNDYPCVRFVASQHHVTAGLATKDEPDALESGTDFPSRKVGGELGHVAVRAESRLRCLDFDELLAHLSGNWIASIAAVLNV